MKKYYNVINIIVIMREEKWDETFFEDRFKYHFIFSYISWKMGLIYNILFYVNSLSDSKLDIQKVKPSLCTLFDNINFQPMF